MAAPEVAHVVAEPPVPLRPRGPEAADLVALAGGVPGLGDQLDRREHRVRGDVGEQRRGRVEAAAAGSSQGRGEVEAEAVDAHRRHPVAQGVDDQAPDQRRRRVEGVAAAGEVDVAAPRVEGVPAGGVQAAPRQRRAVGAALAGVVEHDVEHDLEARGVQGRRHRPELLDLAAGRRRVARLRGEVGERRVAPVVGAPAGEQRRLVGVGEHRQQLERRHPEPDEVVDHRGVGERRRRCRGGARGRPGGAS